MTKQEFLAMSLGKGLVLQSPYGFRPNRKESTGILGFAYLTGDLYADIENKTFPAEFIPICRPLSDLTKEIEHKGEKFVPIVRLIEIAFDVEVNTNRVELSFEDDMYIAEINGFEFVFDITDNSLLSFKHNLPSVVPKQLLLFQKLIEWHFDLFGGIENKEAINVNNLKINPYK